MSVLQRVQAIWENQFYYMFGFLFLVFIILIISCSQISIVMVYFQLCGEVSRNSHAHSFWPVITNFESVKFCEIGVA